MEKIFVGMADDFEGEKVKVVRVGKHDVTVCFHEGRYHAFKDACPHQSQPLSRGTVANGVVTCPGHNWQFDLTTGKCLKGDREISLRQYDVVIENNRVFIRA